jgi:electron transfer flavoprotein alpha subunit
MPAGVAIIADVENGVARPGTLDLAAWAETIVGQGGGEVHWVAVGHGAAQAGSKLAGDSGYPVTALEIAPEVVPTGTLWGDLLLPLLKEMRPEVVGLLHTTLARDCAAALAIGLDAACIAGVQGIARPNEEIMFQRAVMGGRLLVGICTEARPVVATVLPGFFKHDNRQIRSAAAVETQRPAVPDARVRLLEIRESETEAALTQAETIIAAGRGIGSEDNLVQIGRLADRFPKSAVAGSRIVCDAGWLPYNRQVGATGATVAPRLYMACGISGTHQHVAGMQGSELVVAINHDPQAAIFNIADIGVVEDLEAFLPLLIEALEKEN